MEFGRGESWLPEILVTVAVERVFTLYMMQDAVREMTIYMNTSIHTSFFIQLHASYMSYAQVTTSNSRERPQIAKKRLKTTEYAHIMT